MSTAIKKFTKDDYERPAPDGVHGLSLLAAPLMDQVAAALPRAVAGTAPRLLRCLMTCCQSTPALLDCSPRSLLGGLIQAAALGLEIGGPAGQAYLLPFKRQATLCVGYKGFITLAARAGAKRFTPRAVRQNDPFDIEYGTDQRIRHAPNRTDPGPVVGYYAVVETPGGGLDFEFLTLAEAQAHRDRYALSKTGPWATAFDEMAKKTCIRKLAKRVPLSAEWVAAATLDEMADEGVPQNLAALVELPAVDRLDELKARAEAANRPGQSVHPSDNGIDEPQ